MRTLLIIGGGAEQVPAYELARKRGLCIVGTDANMDAPALKLAHHKILSSTRDSEQTVEKVKDFSFSHKIDGVMTIANDVPLTVAKVAEELGLTSIGSASAKLFSNKLLMKEAFNRFNVPCPWFSSVKSATELEKLMIMHKAQKYVLKPVDGRGARGVIILDDKTDLGWAFEESSKYGESKEMILEEFVEGYQFSTESFLLDGVCYTPAISERNYSRFNQFWPNMIEDGGTIPANLSSVIRDKINSLILNGAAALGVRYGLVKGDIVLDCEGNPKIIELAARLSGGWFASHQIPSATGVNLVDAVITYALGGSVTKDKLLPKIDKGNAMRFWFPRPGKIKKIYGESDLKKIPGLVKYGFYKKLGDIQPKIKMHSDRFGYVICEGKNRVEAERRVEKAISCVRIETE